MCGRRDGAGDDYREAELKLLFVCMGNICRSPTAEGVMRHLLREEGLEDVRESVEPVGDLAERIPGIGRKRR